MLEITRFTVEDLEKECVTDKSNPCFSYTIASQRQNTTIKKAVLTLGEWTCDATSGNHHYYDGPPLEPFATYTVHLTVEDDQGNQAAASCDFETGKMDGSFLASWITNGSYRFTEKKASPKPMYFKHTFSCQKSVVKARIYATALGIYEMTLNGEKIGRDYFAPGFTSYKHQLQYQTYDITKQLAKSNEMEVVVAGGWASGAFTYARRNRVYAKRQAFLAEVHIEYSDGSFEKIVTDTNWQTAMEGPLKEAEFYNGEIYDARFHETQRSWQPASLETVKIKPRIIAQIGVPVREHEVFEPTSMTRSPSGKWLYDMGQNFAGIVKLTIQGNEGQKLTIRHAEILMDGELFTEPLRTAKQAIIYTCKEGKQVYQPRLTYMGFRYLSVEGIDPEAITIEGIALYSDVRETGSFTCSNPQLNQLQSNILWGAKSNFVDIPTDCPQRDERMGWTGDIALFARTASTNFDMRRFYEKWLQDVRSEQRKSGGIPVTVPLVVVPFQWEIMIPMAVDHWGDAVILVPWAEYLSSGDPEILRTTYHAMKKYHKACLFWAQLFSFGKHRRIWRLLHHYGDWVAPEGKLWTWMLRGKWTGTASLANTSNLLAQIATILGYSEDSTYYQKIFHETSTAYRQLLMDKDARVKKEFQTAYVLPLYYQMLSETDAKKAAANLARLVRENEYHIGTGFPGTPYILFALADNGYVEEAYRMLLTDTCPSWLFLVKAGGTTIWERWDALREDGTSNTGADDGTNGMVSFNHYASGAVGDFFYRRIAGIEPIKGGYQAFTVRPIIGGDLTFAKTKVRCSYGEIISNWQIADGYFSIEVQVPIGTTAYLQMPSGQRHQLTNGQYHFSEAIGGSSA